MIRRSNHREHLIAAMPGAGQQIARRHNIVAAVEKARGDGVPIHHVFLSRPQPLRERDQCIGRKQWHVRRPVEAEIAPDLFAVRVGAEALEALVERPAAMPVRPKQPNFPPIAATTGTPRTRVAQMARITSDTAINPALASCNRTPPDSSSSTTPATRCVFARSNRPTIFAPWTSPTAPPMKP